MTGEQLPGVDAFLEHDIRRESATVPRLYEACPERIVRVIGAPGERDRRRYFL